MVAPSLLSLYERERANVDVSETILEERVQPCVLRSTVTKRWVCVVFNKQSKGGCSAPGPTRPGPSQTMTYRLRHNSALVLHYALPHPGEWLGGCLGTGWWRGMAGEGERGGPAAPLGLDDLRWVSGNGSR